MPCVFDPRTSYLNNLDALKDALIHDDLNRPLEHGEAEI